MLFFLFVIYFVLSYTVLRRAEKLEGAINAVLFFSVFHFVYYVSIPLESFVTNNYTLRDYSFDTDVSTNVMLWAISSYFGFALGYYIQARNYVVNLSDFFNVSAKKPPAIVGNLRYIVILSTLLFLVIFPRQILESSSYEGNVFASAGNSFYKFSISLLTLLYALYAMFLFLFKRNKEAVLITIVPVIWGVYSSDKNPIVISVAILILILLNSVAHMKRKVSSFVIYASAILIIPVLSISFSLYRADALSELDLNVAIYKNTDARGPFRSIILEPTKEKELLLGATYLRALILWVPEFIWSERPLDLSVQFAQENMANWEKGLGMGYSPMAEAYINFGHIGPFLSFFLISSILYYMRTRQLRGNKMVFYIVTTLFLFHYFIIMHRAPFNLPAYIMRLYIPLLMVVYLANRRWQMAGSSVHPA